MTAKEYLNGVRQKQLHCRMLLEKIEELETQASGLRAITYDKDRVQVSPSNTMESVIVKMMEVADEYKAELDEYKAEVDRVKKQINEMPNQLHAELLRYRYIETDNGRRMSLELISCKMHKSFEWVRHLHGEALQAFAKRYL